MSTEWRSLAGVDIGLLPLFLSEGDDRPAKEQINERYAHGGGWHPFKGFQLWKRIAENPMTWKLRYPGDPHMNALAWTNLRRETIVLFEGSWLAIVQNTGDYEVSRVD